MSKTSARKLQKRKERERRVAGKKLLVADRRLYARQFPEFEFRTNNAPDGFVDLIRRIIRQTDLRDGTLFRPDEIRFFKLLKAAPGPAMTELQKGLRAVSLEAMHYLSVIGVRVFSRIPAQELRQWIPYHDVQFLPAGPKIIVRFRSLERVKGQGGTIYFSPHRPTLEVNGEKKVIGWSRHAIERTCERLAPRWDSYLGLGDVFALFYQCVHFERHDLHGGRQIAFTFFDRCGQGFFSGAFAEAVLGRVARQQCYYRVGYCPAVVEGDFLKAVTLLYPGYAGTPEYGIIQASGQAWEQKRRMVERAGRMTREHLEKSGDFSLAKWFHDNGVPQVIETNEEFYA